LQEALVVNGITSKAKGHHSFPTIWSILQNPRPETPRAARLAAFVALHQLLLGLQGKRIKHLFESKVLNRGDITLL
jgi:hypothetical protein